MTDELRWSTGAVGPQHRAIMRGGKVMAVAEDTETAAHIVRALNDSHTLNLVRDGLDALRVQIMVGAAAKPIKDEIERLMRMER